MSNLPFVSIVMPCRNETSFIGQCLNSIIDNDYPKDRLEVLVVDGMSEDGTRSVVKQFSRQHSFIRLLNNPKQSTPAALNIGVASAKWEIIMRMDAHTIYDRKYITNCVRALDDYKADNVGGVWKIIPRTHTLLGKAIAQSLCHPFGIGNAHYRIGNLKESAVVDTVPFFCCRRETLQQLGPFNENLIRSQDMEFSLRLKRAGGKIVLVPDIVSHYYARSDLKSFLKHNWANGVWAIVPFLYSDGMPVSWRHLVPLAFAAGLLVSTVLAMMTPMGLWLLVAIVGSYATVNLLASAQISIKQRHPAYFLLMPVVFFALHLGYGLGSLWGFVKVVPRMLRPSQAKNMSAQLALLKRSLDLMGSLLGLLFLAPLMAVLAVLVKSDGGPILYRGARIGQHGRLFHMLKFRTMVVNAEKIGGSSTANDDPRLTYIGRSLRRFKLDELPQLINVLRGDMSLVGPRPQVQWAVDLYTNEERALLNVRPGITDYASLAIRDEGAILRGSADPDRDYLEKIHPVKMRLGLEYLSTMSLWVDLKIILATLGSLAGIDSGWCFPSPERKLSQPAGGKLKGVRCEESPDRY